MGIESMHTIGNSNEAIEYQAGMPISVEQVDLPAVQVDVRHGESSALTEAEVEAASEFVSATEIQTARVKRLGQVAESGVRALGHNDAEAIQEVATRDAAINKAMERRRFN